MIALIALIALIAFYAIDSALEWLDFDSIALCAMKFQIITTKRAYSRNLMYEVQ